METTPAATLRSVPERATTRSPKETSSPEKTKGSDSAEKVPLGQKVRSSKKSGHKKSSFAAAYRKALKGTPEASPEEGPEKTAKKERRKGSVERPSKNPEPSRKKHRPINETEKVLLSEVSGDPLTGKHISHVYHHVNVPSHAKVEDSSHAKKVLWGPLVLSKKTASMPPTSPPAPAVHPGTAPVLPGKMIASPVIEGEKAKPFILPPPGQKIEKKGPEKGKENSDKDGKTMVGEVKSEGRRIHADHRGIPIPREKNLAETDEKTTMTFPASSVSGALHEKPTSSVQGAKAKEISSHSPVLAGASEGGSIHQASMAAESETAPSLPDGFQGRIDTLARGGGGEVSLDVKPPHLGPVGVRVHVDPHTRLVTVSLASHDPQIRHLLTEKEGSIKESLSQSGFVLDRFQVIPQPPPGSETLSVQGLSGSGMGMTSSSDGSGGMSGQGGSGLDAGVGGGGLAQDFANLARQGSDASGQERGSGAIREVEGVSPQDQESPSIPASLHEEGKINTGYHRIA